MKESKEQNFYITIGKATVFDKEQKVILSTSEISWEQLNKPQKRTAIPLRRIIAVIPCDCSSKQRLSCQYCQQTSVLLKGQEPGLTRSTCSELLPLSTQAFKIYCASPKGKYNWKLRDVTIRPSQDINAREWISLIQKALNGLNRPKSLLIFVNPFGGKKKAPSIFKEKVSPLLCLAGVKAEVVITERANHAKDLLQEISLEKYDGLVCVGGDGMFCELLNGIILRTERDANISVNEFAGSLLRPNMTIGVIPAGSTDAISYCTIGINNVLTSTLLIVMGDKISLDVSSIHNNGLLQRYAATFLSYGYFGDVIVESEKHRWMGPARYNWSGFLTLLHHRSYRGELKMQVVRPHYIPYKNHKCIVGCLICLKAREAADASHEATVPPEPPETSWVSVSGKFKAVSAASLSCRCGMSKDGLSPTAHLGDGCTDMVVLKKCSVFELIRYLYRISRNSSELVNLPHVEFYRVRQFHFNPTVGEMAKEGGEHRGSVIKLTDVLDTPVDSKVSAWNCDGEVLKEADISVRVHCQLINIFASGIEDRQSSLDSTSFFRPKSKKFT